MKETITDQIMNLKNKSLEELKTKYEETFKGEKPTSNNKISLWHKIAYRLQEDAYGSLPATAQERIGELIKMYDPINNTTLRSESSSVTEKKKPLRRDRRLPIPGAIIRKSYKGSTVEVKVLERGFEYNDKVYRTLSAVATAITGDHWNGYKFFTI